MKQDTGTPASHDGQLWAFSGALALGGWLMFFQHTQIIALLTLAAIALTAALGFAAYIFRSRLPKLENKIVLYDDGPPARLGSWHWLLAATLLAVAVFMGFPNLDLNVARYFYAGHNQFIGEGSLGNFARAFGNVTPFLVLAFILLAYAMSRRGTPLFYRPSGKDLAFVALAMIIGPGLIVNLGMKDHLHRPRPVQVLQLDGTRPFKPFYKFDGACPRNCSFPSGEGAEAFWMLAPASLVPPPWRVTTLVGALVFGVFTSTLRLAFGGHFLSDVTFAALIMWGVMLGLRRWIYGPDSS